jgi:hypothetical protein
MKLEDYLIPGLKFRSLINSDNIFVVKEGSIIRIQSENVVLEDVAQQKDDGKTYIGSTSGYIQYKGKWAEIIHISEHIGNQSFIIFN